MSGLLRLVVSLGLLVAAAFPSSAAPGDTVEGVLTLAGKQVPLPPGQWVVAAEATEGEGADAMAAVVLARAAGNAVDGLVVARANLRPRTAIFGSTAECDRADTYLAYVAYDTTQDGLCSFLNLVLLSPKATGPAVWASARQWLVAKRMRLDAQWLTAGFRAKTRAHAVDVRYYFAPPLPGLQEPAAWADSPWAPDRAVADPVRNAVIAKLAAWAAWTRDAVADGVRGRIDADMLPPWPWEEGDLVRRLVERRLRALDELRALGAVDEETYAAQRKVLSEVVVAPERSELSLQLRAFWKTVTYRVASILDSLGVSYIILGSPLQSLGFAAIGEVIRPPAVYLHEIAWARSGVGRPPPAGARELEEIGLSR